MTVLPRRSFKATSLPFSSCKVKSGALSWIFMGIFLGKSKSIRAFASALGQPAFSSIVPRTILYRGWLLVMLLVCTIVCAGMVAAQEERPQIDRKSVVSGKGGD